MERTHYVKDAKAMIGKETVNQRVSYNTLDVEQLGYMYEGLLDHTVLNAKELVVKLKGKDDIKLPISELKAHQNRDFEKWLKDETKRSSSVIKKALNDPPDIETIST